MNENEHLDHLDLRGLLQQAKRLLIAMSPIQQKKWIADSPLALEISVNSRSTRSITPSSALSSVDFFPNQRVSRPNNFLTPSMPDRRSVRSPLSKKSCRSGHGILIHHKKITPNAVTHPCWFPGCKCTNYRPEKQK